MPEVKPIIESLAKIKVLGVGGCGGSAINRMISANIKGVEFIAVNTDLQALHTSKAPIKLHIGKQSTKGLGAGMNPAVGRAAAEESQNEIRDILKGADMVFITCGLGGGTGSGAAPIIAQIAKDFGALTIAVVTKPFEFEGSKRMEIAEAAHDALSQNVDTIITVNNDRVLEIVAQGTSMADSFKVIDDVLRQGVQGISEVITTPSLINVDFADVRTIMSDAGSALMGVGRASGENRAVEAAKAAIANPLLDVDMDGARGILFVITGGRNLGMHEVSAAAKIITGSSDEGAKVIFGANIDENMQDEIRITVIATGFGESRIRKPLKITKQEPSATFSRNTFGPLVRDVNNDDKPRALKPFEHIFKHPSVAPQMKTEPSFSRPETLHEDEQDSFSDDVVKKNDAELDEDYEIPAFLRKKLN